MCPIWAILQRSTYMRTQGKATLKEVHVTTVVHAKGASSAAVEPAHGVLFVHSCPRALSPHLEWALARVFGTPVSIDWAEQPIERGSVRAEIIWNGPVGTGARVASAVLAFTGVRYEVTEDATPGREGERFAATPSLGLFRASIGAHGDVMVSEERLRSALHHSHASAPESMASLAEEISRLIGDPWDTELEAFRCAHADSTVRVLHHVI